MLTIGKILDESRGLGKGFDFLRVALAFGVVIWHTASISNGSFNVVANSRFLWLFDYSILMMFFALSGFLIAGSALRLSLKNFIINRSLRIIPALAVEIVLSALLIGSYFTVLPLHSYFSNFQTYHYFTNIVGLINYRLPGVFVHNPVPQVNESLWTVPFEIGCYAIMAICIRFGLLRRPVTVLVFAAICLGAGLLLLIAGFQNPQHGFLAHIVNDLFIGRGSKLFIAFLLGIAAYLYRYKIPYSWSLFWVCVAYYCALAFAGHAHYPDPWVALFAVIPLIYMLVFLGVTALPTLPLFHRGDYSYGVYLYGWPIMQVMRTLFPNIGGHPWALLLISLPTITLFAVFSWHAIEKPILKLRKKFSFVARQRLAESAPNPELAGAEHDTPIIGEIAGDKSLSGSKS